MKARATLLAIPVMLGVAFAQQQSGSTGQQGTSGQTQGGSQTGASGSQSGATGKSGGMADQSTAATTAQTTGMAEIKTSTFKGTLVDLACGGASANAAGAGQSDTATTAKTTASEAGATAGGSTAGQTGASGAANRSTSDGSGCPVTANSTQLGMKLDKTGQVVRFDLVGNQRAIDALKTNKGWNKNLTANKPIKASISGALQGDKLIVSAIH